MRDLDFTYNWNNKLDCTGFTTIRVNGNYKVGEIVQVKLNGKPYKRAEIIDKRSFLLHQLTEGTAMIDTGYGKIETINIFQKMYKNKGLDFTKRPIYLYILRTQSTAQDKKLKQVLQEQGQLFNS